MPGSIESSWSQSGGVSIGVEDYVDSNNPFLLTIPACTLEASQTYTFRITLESGDDTTYSEV